jgi:NTP pyrophosphatase (non-canonical NTP hydrolase)
MSEIVPRYTFAEYAAERLKAQGEPFPDTKDKLCIGCLGLAGEVGEAVELIKKHLYHGKPLDRAKVVKELGDVAWYLMFLADAVGSSLEEVALTNNAKLRERYPNGFSVEAAARKPDSKDAEP